MADCSLDDYIRQKGIGLNMNKRTTGTNIGGNRTNFTITASGGNRNFAKPSVVRTTVGVKPLQKFDARRLLPTPAAQLSINKPQVSGIGSRLGGTTKQVGGKFTQITGVTATAVGAAATRSSGFPDARQRILAKTKFGDARQRILSKKTQNEGTAAQTNSFYDVRQKLEAKKMPQGMISQRFSVYTTPTTPEISFEEPEPTFQLSAVANPLIAASRNQPGMTHFSNSIMRTVINPLVPAFSTKPTMTVPSRPQNSRIQLNVQQQLQSVVDQQPIQTVISQRPIKAAEKLVAPSPIVSKAKLAMQPVVEKASPLKGFCIKVSNLHPNVSHEDILELFGAIGALKRARLVRPGFAEVVYVKYEDAVTAVSKYHMRELDGLPMNLLFDDKKPAEAANTFKLPEEYLSHRLGKPASSQVSELEPSILHKALFKSSADQTPTKPVSFTVHM